MTLDTAAAGVCFEPGATFFRSMLETVQNSSTARTTAPPLALIRSVVVLIVSIGVCVGVGAYITAHTPTTYEAQATLLVTSGTSAPSGGVGDVLGSLGLGRDNSSASYASAILSSHTFAQQVVRELNLLSDKRFNPTGKLDIERAGLALKGSAKVMDNKSGVLTLTVDSSSADLAAKIANSYLSLFKESVETANTKKRVYTDTQIANLRSKLDALQEKLKRLNQSRDVVDLPQQTAAAVSNLSNLQTQLTNVRTQLEGVVSDLKNTGDLDELANLKAKEQSLQAQQLEIEKAIADVRSHMGAIPETALEQARLEREISVTEKSFETVAQQNELAKIAEQGDLGAYQIIDLALPPRVPIRPKPGLNLAISVVLGLAVGLAINLLMIPEKPEPGQ